MKELTKLEVKFAAELHLPVTLKGINKVRPEEEVECERILEILRAYGEDGRETDAVVCAGFYGNVVYRSELKNVFISPWGIAKLGKQKDFEKFKLKVFYQEGVDF